MFPLGCLVFQPDSPPGDEEMRKVELFEVIRRDHAAHGWGVRRLARVHSVHRRLSPRPAQARALAASRWRLYCGSALSVPRLIGPLTLDVRAGGGMVTAPYRGGPAWQRIQALASFRCSSTRCTHPRQRSMSTSPVGA
jgi:hypothetical protein